MGLGQLVLPIALSGVFVFIVSSIVHMVLQTHKSEYQMIPQEVEFLSAVRKYVSKPGQYTFPGCTSMKELGNPETLKKFQDGPVGILTVRPNGVPGLGLPLAQWFVFCIVVAIFAAYVGSLALPAGASYVKVFQITGAVAVLGHSTTSTMESIWKGRSWVSTARYTVEGIVYGLVTAGTFGWLWPKA